MPSAFVAAPQAAQHCTCPTHAHLFSTHVCMSAQVRFFCNAMPWVDCTTCRYHCTKLPDVDLCPDAFAEGRFPPGCSGRDFIRIDQQATPVRSYDSICCFMLFPVLQSGRILSKPVLKPAILCIDSKGMRSMPVAICCMFCWERSCISCLWALVRKHGMACLCRLKVPGETWKRSCCWRGCSCMETIGQR